MNNENNNDDPDIVNPDNQNNVPNNSPNTTSIHSAVSTYDSIFSDNRDELKDTIKVIRDNNKKHLVQVYDEEQTVSDNSGGTDLSTDYYKEEVKMDAFTDINCTSKPIVTKVKITSPQTGFSETKIPYPVGVRPTTPLPRTQSYEKIPINEHVYEYNTPSQQPNYTIPVQQPNYTIPTQQYDYSYPQTAAPRQRSSYSYNGYAKQQTPYESQYRTPRSGQQYDTIPQVIHNWSTKNEAVVKQWKVATVKLSFIYDTLLELNKTTLENLSIAGLCISAISTLFSVSQFGVEDHTMIAIIFKILLVASTASVTIISGISRIKAYDKTSQELSTYIQKIDSFIGRIRSQLLLPHVIREDAIEFIRKENKDYTELMINTPSICPSALKEANQKYVEFIGDNTKNIKQLQKYYTGDNSMDVEMFDPYYVQY